MTLLTQEQIEKIIELRKNTTMDNASVAAQLGLKKGVIIRVVCMARKRGVRIPRSKRLSSKQSQFEKAIQKFL